MEPLCAERLAVCALQTRAGQRHADRVAGAGLLRFRTLHLTNLCTMSLILMEGPKEDGTYQKLQETHLLREASMKNTGQMQWNLDD